MGNLKKYEIINAEGTVSKIISADCVNYWDYSDRIVLTLKTDVVAVVPTDFLITESP